MQLHVSCDTCFGAGRVEDKLGRKTTISVLGCIGLTALALSGCASSNASGGDPGAMSMPAGSSCQSVRGEFDKLDSRGTPSRVEAASRGARLAPGQQAEVDRYNYLLNLYLGARCHV